MTNHKSILKCILLVVCAVVGVITPSHVQSAIVVTVEEKKCLEETADLFDGNDGLISARHVYAESMEMDMTSSSTMTASYPDEPLNAYKAKCASYGGQMHLVKIDFFDCKLQKMGRDVELTLKNFANCLAAIPECENFDQENLLEEAWDEMGLHCELEDAPSKTTPAPKPRQDDDDGYSTLDDDLANQEKEDEKEEKEAAAKGAEDEAVPYVPKEEMAAGKNQSTGGKPKKKKSGFWTFLMFVAVGGGVFYMHKQGQLRYFRGGRQLPFGGVSTSRFQERGPAPNMFQTSYSLVAPGGGGEEEFNFVPSVDNELQLSSNLM